MADGSGGRPENEPGDNPSVEASSTPAGTEQTMGLDVPLPEEFLADVPSEHRPAIQRLFASVRQFASPAVDPILQRITSEHVSRIIDLAENNRIREHEADKSRRRYQFAYFLGGAALTVGLIVLFTFSDNKDLIAPIVTAVAGFLGGLAAGRYWRS